MISSKIIADSISEYGKRLTTFELVYPRFIHSELMTHRMLSKNAASSRAIPIQATIDSITKDPAMPVYWGKNQSGMSAKEELSSDEIEACKKEWLDARDNAIKHAQNLIGLKLHKQIANRILEPWVNIKVVCSGTEFDNLFHLRLHKDAQPEFQALVKSMYKDYLYSQPELKKEGEWHLPYVSDEDKEMFSIEDCLKLSASLCAQVSYRKSDESMAKAIAIYDRLIGGERIHASPFEHQGTPIGKEDRSGNFIGWKQFRHTFKDHTCYKYNHENI